MFKLFASVLIATLAVQAATLQDRACSSPDKTTPVCQTSGGSPKVSDCVAALQKLGNNVCHQYNNVGSYCTSIVTVGTCKIDVCGYPGAQIADGVHCGGYYQTIINDCQSNGLVGGYLLPMKCNVEYGDQPYKLQFSHS